MARKAQKHIRSIRWTLTRNVAAIVAVLTLVISAAGSALFYRSATAQNVTIRINAVKNIAANIASELSQLEFSAALLATNSQLQENLRRAQEFDTQEGAAVSTEQYILMQEIRRSLAELSAVPAVYALGVYYHANDQVRFFSGITRYDLYNLQAVREAVMKVRGAPNTVQYSRVFSLWKTQKCIALVRQAGNNKTLHPFAELALLVNASSFTRMLSNQDEGAASLYLLDEAGGVISSAGGSAESAAELGVAMSDFETGSGVLPGGIGSQILYARIDGAPWTLIELTDNTGIIRSIAFNAMLLPLIAVCCLLCSLLVINRMARRLEYQLHAVIDDMERVANGALVEAVPNHAFRETDDVCVNLNRMVKRLKEDLDTIYRKEIKQKEAEFYSLQAQINPHFFYNTLDVINMLLLVRSQYDLSELVVDLADILRFNVSRRQTVIPLGDEIALIGKYMQIMEYRFKDRLHYETDCAPETLQYPIVRRLVQPLVENAVLHGMENNSDPCTVSLRSWFEDGQLLVEVRDDGAGIDPETAAKIMDGTYQKDYTRSSGVGLKNIVQRVRLYYGPQYGLRIEPMPQGGTLARLNLPQTPPDGLEGEQHENLAG